MVCYYQVQIFHVAPKLFYVFLKRITIIIYFPNIKYYVLLKASHDVQKTCYTIYRVKGYRNPPPSVGKVMEKDHFRDEGEDNIKMELGPKLK